MYYILANSGSMYTIKTTILQEKLYNSGNNIHVCVLFLFLQNIEPRDEMFLLIGLRQISEGLDILYEHIYNIDFLILFIPKQG